MSGSEAISGTQGYLRQAVQRQMLADVPVGAFLSGGLDSSAIVAFARENNHDISCFTIDTQGGQEKGVVEDLPYARKVAKHLSVPLNVVTINSSSMANDLEFMIRQLDEPIADPAALNVYYISKLARDQGMKVLLSGAGGDDLFTGYRRHRALDLEGYWTALPQALRKRISGLSKHLNQRTLISRRLSKLLSGAHMEGDDRIINYFLWAQETNLIGLYTPETRAQLGIQAASEPMHRYLQEIPGVPSSLEKMLALEQRFFLADHNLIYTDKMSMAAGVEVRVPFLDLDLVNFSAKIPMQYKQRGSEGKWVLKKALEPYLPRDVIYRSKSGIGAPLRRWFKNELRDLIGDYLSEQSLRSRGLFDPFAVQSLIKNNDQGKIDASYTILSLVSIEIWCRSYLDA
jgi:asparagine synthase (glutamine-hydrolysing)